mmetsp:Transcript_7728/g.19134  ORF Transcript_7728/g.19134 Transcript_7728/m.19134 type:complete len:255 (-) Transcript_7728:4046-4810(-)
MLVPQRSRASGVAPARRASTSPAACTAVLRISPSKFSAQVRRAKSASSKSSAGVEETSEGMADSMQRIMATRLAAAAFFPPWTEVSSFGSSVASVAGLRSSPNAVKTWRSTPVSLSRTLLRVFASARIPEVRYSDLPRQDSRRRSSTKFEAPPDAWRQMVVTSCDLRASGNEFTTSPMLSIASNTFSLCSQSRPGSRSPRDTVAFVNKGTNCSNPESILEISSQAPLIARQPVRLTAYWAFSSRKSDASKISLP